MMDPCDFNTLAIEMMQQVEFIVSMVLTLLHIECIGSFVAKMCSRKTKKLRGYPMAVSCCQREHSIMK